MLKVCLETRDVHNEQIALFNETFNVCFTKEMWERKHFENPYTKNSENMCLYDEDKLIGFNLFMPQKYNVDGEEYIFLQSCESVVDRDERGKGNLKKILMSAENALKDKYKVIYGVPNKNSKPTFDKLGYKEKLSLDSMFKIGSIKNIITDVILKKKKLRKSFEECESINYSSKITEEIKNIKRTKHRIEIVRDVDFYNWKIDCNINREFYYLYITDEIGNVDAYCIVYFSSSGKVRRADIVDFYVKEGHEESFRTILREIKKRVSIISSMITSGSLEQSIFLRQGFLYRKKKIASLVYKVISDNKSLERHLEEKDWSFMFIEADTILN